MTEAENQQDDHGKLYWLCHHTTNAISGFFKSHKKTFIGIVIVVLVVLFLFRSVFQPFAVEVRKYFVPMTLFIGVLTGIWFGFAKLIEKFTKKPKNSYIRMTSVVVVILLTMVCWDAIVAGYKYVALYRRYQTLDLVDLDRKPLTDRERIHPQNSVYSRVRHSLADHLSPTSPKYVRIGDDYCWTMAIQPKSWWSRSIDGITEIFCISGTSPALNFKDNRHNVNFNFGENLWFSRNIYTATKRNFGPIRFFSYEPKDVFRLCDDEGNWVQVVSLNKWEGIFCPRQEPGGVQIIKQESRHPNWFVRIFIGMGRWAKRVTIGAGTFVKPKDFDKYPFLQRQNIVSDDVSRYKASSFRFQNGFWAPFHHRGDIRIADQEEDMNAQPFTTCWYDVAGSEVEKPYDAFCLEPYDPGKRGLNTSVFVPADGERKVYAYRHYDKNEILTGPSAISSHIRNSKKNYNWQENAPVENRPYVKEIDGIRRFMYITTVVTMEKQGVDNVDKKRFIGGNIPEIVITDAEHLIPVWVNPLKPETWDDQIKEELSTVWESN